ncbi:MAG: SDR family oxidoreductase [Pseudomonadota bacterium]
MEAQMLSNLAGKVALVTGSTGGIGRGAALRLAALGATVVVTGRTPHKGEAVVAQIRDGGGKSIFIAGDVLSKPHMDALCARVAEACGGLDIVVANAGGNDDEARSPQVRGPFGDLDLARVTALIGDATTAKLLPVQSALPYMLKRGGGSVVFVTSEGGRVPTSGQTAVATFSGGLIMATKVLAKELARENVRVNCVAVTVVRDTPSWQAMQGAGAMSAHHKQQYEKIEAMSPLGLASPQDIGAVIAFLASSDSRYVTGATLSATGGLTFS